MKILKMDPADRDLVRVNTKVLKRNRHDPAADSTDFPKSRSLEQEVRLAGSV